MLAVNWSWLLIAIPAVIAGLVGAKLLKRIAEPEHARLARTSLIVIAISALVVAYFNFYPWIGNGVAVFAFVMAGSLPREASLVSRQDEIAPPASSL